MNICKVDGCNRLIYCKEMCNTHYRRVNKYGITNLKSIKERFEEKIEMIPECGCWIYTGADANGYGRFSINTRNYFAHRISYELYIGSIPRNICVLHRCDTPLCVNPNHLFLGTKYDNSQDAINKGRTLKKLSLGNIIEIKNSLLSQSTLANKFKVSQATISRNRRDIK